MRIRMDEYSELDKHAKEWRGLCAIVNDARAKNQRLNFEALAFLHENFSAARSDLTRFISKCQSDLAKRIRRRRAIIALVIIWPILTLFGMAYAEFVADSSWIMAVLGSYILSTYSLCWVGFPVGWNKVREWGNYNPYVTFFALIAGLFTMCFSSYLWAFIGIFTEGRDIKYIKSVIKNMKEVQDSLSNMKNYLYQQYGVS